MRMLKKIISILLFITCFISANAQVPKGFNLLSNETEFREKLLAVSNSTQSIKSNFTQEKNLNVLSEKITSKGEFRFKKLNKVRMEYTSPFKYLLIINGDKITIKDDQKTNSFSSKSNKLFAVINNIVLDCVQGTALENKDFTKKIYKTDKEYLLILSPQKKELKEFFNSINIYLDAKDCSVIKLDMLESTGDNTLITFTNKEYNVTIPDAVFISN